MKHPSLYSTVPVIDPKTQLLHARAQGSNVKLCLYYVHGCACEVIYIYIYIILKVCVRYVRYVIRHSCRLCYTYTRIYIHPEAYKYTHFLYKFCLYIICGYIESTKKGESLNIKMYYIKESKLK